MEFLDREHKRRRTNVPEKDPALYSPPNMTMYGPMTSADTRVLPRYAFQCRPAERVESMPCGPAQHRTHYHEAQRLAISGAEATRAKVEALAPEVPKKKPRKRAHYLQHTVRCAIIRRVAQGEPQASLAREFGVTRAAVCQMYKNRGEILNREDSEDEAGSQLPTLEAHSKTVKLLLSTLKDARTSAAAFRRAAARLTFIVVEEVLASFDAQEVELIASNGLVYDGLQQSIPFCGITLGEDSAAFATALAQIDPGAPTGQISVKEENGGYWRLVLLDVPADIANVEVLLFSTSGNGGAECKAIEALRNIGVRERNISVVMVICTSSGFEEIATRFPNITVLAATIDDEWTLEGGFH